MHALSHIYTVFWRTIGKVIQVVKIYLSSLLLTYCNISYWRLLKNVTEVSKSLLRLGSILIYYDCFIPWEFYAYVKCTVIISTISPFNFPISLNLFPFQLCEAFFVVNVSFLFCCDNQWSLISVAYICVIVESSTGAWEFTNLPAVKPPKTECFSLLSKRLLSITLH